MKRSLPTPGQQLEQILNRYAQLSKPGDIYLYNCSSAEQTEITTSMIAAIQRLAPDGSYFLESLRNAVKENVSRYSSVDRHIVPELVGIIQALKTAYESGYFYELEALVRADIFAEFLDMGEYLLREGYKDPSAVIIGGVLEEHLRKLCTNNAIDTTISGKPKKAEQMNSELSKANVYTVLDQKSVTSWLDLRNKAAHAKYTEYTDDQVKLMLMGVRDFVSRLPA